MPDNDTARKVCVDYTIAAAKALIPLAEEQDGKKFRFVYLSGGAAERDQSRSLWFKGDYRRIRVSTLIRFASNLHPYIVFALLISVYNGGQIR